VESPSRRGLVRDRASRRGRIPPTGSVDPIEEYIREHFRHWEIALPQQDVAARADGHLFARGWHIGYVWGSERGEEYLEVLAQHRMTDDTHVRVFASGRVEDLPAPGPSYMYGPNATEAEKQEAQRKNIARNQRIYADLRERGLLPPPGQNLPAHEINEYLRSRSDAGASPAAADEGS
jgi:hypothetical protein